jgi:hypothetical protein
MALAAGRRLHSQKPQRFSLSFVHQTRYTNTCAQDTARPKRTRLLSRLITPVFRKGGFAMFATLGSQGFLCMQRILFGATVVLAVASSAAAALPAKEAERTKVVGRPLSLVAQPSTVRLMGPHSMQQIVVSGRYTDGNVRDLTPFCNVSVESAGIVEVQENLFLVPHKNGVTALILKAGGQAIRVPISVSGFDQPQPVSFRREMIAVLNVGGCNQGACHGTPSGKNSFKLSLRGYDPAADYMELTHDVFGRRTARLDADSSMIYLKALGRIRPFFEFEDFGPSDAIERLRAMGVGTKR